MPKLEYQITLCQNGNEVTFKLNEKEYRYAKRCVERDDFHNFTWFAFADYVLTPAKRGRFYKNFDYHKGDFYAYNCGKIEED